MMKYLPVVEKWGVQEIVCLGRTDGNPFTDYDMMAEFTSDGETALVHGFYDGDGRYITRFMPSHEGHYVFRVRGSFGDEEYTGAFDVTAPSEGNHGPVKISQTYHFAYADGTRYIPVGTTCYVWQLQTPELFEKTLRTLEDAPFNKIRFCVFPKRYVYNQNEPYTYPYERTPCGEERENDWDFRRFNPAHFQHLEEAIRRLCALGIEADIIVLHPYDCWGFSTMSREEDQLYFRYLASRISAYRNVWWSLANEYDLLHTKTQEDWEACAAALQANDPYHHLMSIHNCVPFYDYTRPWVTHCCMQRQDIYRTTEYVDEWRVKYGKPIIVDEMGYEGNIPYGWGSLSGEEIVRRFWEATIRGGYGGHGETFVNDQDILWWSHGDELHGQSPARLRFLRDFLSELPGPLQRARGNWDDVAAMLEGDNDDTPQVVIYYHSFMQPSYREYTLPEGTAYEIEVIDTWNMTREKRGVFSGRVKVMLPGRSYMAICMRRVK